MQNKLFYSNKILVINVNKSNIIILYFYKFLNLTTMSKKFIIKENLK